jgi:hypothetical protein
MEYKLITSTGKVYEFYSLGLAEMYKNLYGGKIIYEKDEKSVAFNS